MAEPRDRRGVNRQDLVMWADRHAAVARKMVPNSRYRRVAAKMAMTDYRALDYLKQAPVILIGACAGKEIKGGAHINMIAGPFGARVKSGMRLRNMMNEYGVAPQFKALDGRAIFPAMEDVVLAISRHDAIKPSALAQAIPEDAAAQETWLRALVSWSSHVRARRPALVNATLPWAVSNIRPQSREPFDPTIVADYWIEHVDTFQPGWTAAQAHARARAWHQEMAAARPRAFGGYSLRQYQDFGRNQVVDYTPYPVGMIVSDLLFEALDTINALQDESANMHHCVRAYAGDVISGRSRIFSVRLGEKRIATLELVGPDGRRTIAQLKGPCNAHPEQDIWLAARRFTDVANEQARFLMGKAA